MPRHGDLDAVGRNKWDEKQRLWVPNEFWERLHGKTDTVEAVLVDRENSHGDYGRNADIAQGIKKVYRGSPKWDALDPHERETLDLIATKIGRILSGNPHFNDHWLDIAGYATLSAQRNPIR